METNFQLISWNLHGVPFFCRHRKARLRRAVSACVDSGADFIALQEVWLNSDALMLTDLGRHAGYFAVTGPNGGGRASGGLLLLARADRWRLTIAPRFFRFRAHAALWKVLEPDGIAHKGMLRAGMTHIQSKTSVTLINTHFQAPYRRWDAYEKIRRSQANDLLDVVRRVPADRLCFVVGDLNTTPQDRPVYSMLASRLVDLTTKYRQQCQREHELGCGTSFESGVTLNWIDYVWFRRTPGASASCDIALIENTARDFPYSDHNGVDAKIRIDDVRGKGNVASALLSPKLMSRRAILGAFSSPQRLASVANGIAGVL